MMYNNNNNSRRATRVLLPSIIRLFGVTTADMMVNRVKVIARSTAEQLPALSRPQLLKENAFIGGEWISSKDNGTHPVYNPANTKIITEVSDVGVKETDQAISAAYSAQKTWSKLPAIERSSYLQKWYQLLIRYQGDLAKIITLEQGKPLAESRGEVNYGASFLEWFAEEGKRVYGDIIPTTATDRRLLVLKQPVGVAALITPWNFPIAMATRKAGAALAAGCTVVLKPSEETPLSALALAELAVEAGIPKGVFNVLPASRESTINIGKYIMDDKRIAKISFTGSTAVGKLLMAGSANTIKRLSLELGGNAPFIVFNSADIPAAINGVMMAKFRNMGQACISPNRFFIQSGIHNEFVEALSKRVASLKVGNGFEEGIEQGPLINNQAIEKVERHVSDALCNGAELVVGGTRIPGTQGHFYKPSVLVNVNNDMLMCNEETFGPVAPVIKFDDEEEAVSMANSTDYGLMGYVYTNDHKQLIRVYEGLETGIVGANEGMPVIGAPLAPFSGIKQSGLGSEGSKYGINEYLHLKYVCLGGLN